MSRIILKGRIFDSTGAEPYMGAVVCDGKKIAEVTKNQNLPVAEDDTVIEVKDGTILPGLIDGHTHFGVGSNNVRETFDDEIETKVCRAAMELKDTLMAGFTYVREVGGFANKLKYPVSQGYIQSPKISAAGRFISSLGGHGDFYNRYPEYCIDNSYLGTVGDGPEELYKVCRRQFREGADFIKIGTTGGAASQGDSSDMCTFLENEIRACVDIAKSYGSYVSTHAHYGAGVTLALKNGVRCIEHGMFLTDEDIELFLKKNAYLTPTYAIGSLWMANYDRLPVWLQRKLDGLNAAFGGDFIAAASADARKAKKAGVKIGLGSDLLGDPIAGRYGENGIEFENLVKNVGMTPAEAIMAGTKTNSEIIMKEKEVGTLEAGKCADVIVVAGNPLENISLLKNADNVKVVIKDGVIEKQID